MKIIVLTLTIFFNLIPLQAQSIYYRNSEGILLNETEIKEAEKKIRNKVNKINKEAIVEIEIKNTTYSKDSIIHDFGFHVNLNGEPSLKTKLSSLIGEKMPVFSLKTLEGDEIDINDLVGKPTLLNFWFANCPPCIDEMPELNKLKKHFGDQINFIAITYESKEKVKKFLKKYDFDFKQVVDAKSLIDDLEITTFPKNIILDKNLTIKNIKNGIPYIKDENGKMKIGEATLLKNKLKKLLNQKI